MVVVVLLLHLSFEEQGRAPKLQEKFLGEL
jgi:hypothetical protein